MGILLRGCALRGGEERFSWEVKGGRAVDTMAAVAAVGRWRGTPDVGMKLGACEHGDGDPLCIQLLLHVLSACNTCLVHAHSESGKSLTSQISPKQGQTGVSVKTRSAVLCQPLTSWSGQPDSLCSHAEVM